VRGSRVVKLLPLLGSLCATIARQTGVSFRTAEVHRSRIMEKLGAKNSVDLVRIALS
jgi:DNA-binding NarL/FixJ family response regulator